VGCGQGVVIAAIWGMAAQAVGVFTDSFVNARILLYRGTMQTEIVPIATTA
jgi:hypothetical protein